MFRTVLTAFVTVCIAACANGWPRVHHPPPSANAAASCTPTGSKISRGDCATSTPAQRESQEDLDRVQRGSAGSVGKLGSPR